MDNIDRYAGICLGNLDRSRDQITSLDTKTRAHLRELAYGLSAILPNTSDSDEEELFRRDYSELCVSLKHRERITLCSYICEKSPRTSERLLEIRPNSSEVTVVYVKNALSDIAFEHFSKEFERAQVYYADNFESALEDVYYSRADHAILPLSSSRNGLMLHFLELIMRYEMKIALSCEVHSITDDSDNRFVLLSKSNICFPEKEGESREFEFILSDASRQLPRVICAAQEYDCKLLFVQTMPSRDTALIRYEVSQSDADALCLYLFLETPGHIPVGLYRAL